VIKKIDDNLSLHYETFFPYSKNMQSQNYKVLIGIGGNLGKSKKRFEKLFNILRKNRQMNILATSPILKNPPFGFFEQPDFYNSLILLETRISPFNFLNYTLYLEKRFGRVRSFKNAPRTLDIDIIFFDFLKIKSLKLTVPHWDWQNRDSVTIPLIYLGRVKK